MITVICKRCTKPFDTVPNRNAHIASLCLPCQTIADQEEHEQLEEESILEDNPYMRKNQYDCLAILNGEFPELKSDTERTICAMELAAFINKCSYGGHGEDVAKFMEYLGITHAVLFVKQLLVREKEYMAKHKAFVRVKDVFKLAE